MRILWLSNRIISPTDSGETGTWLIALANAIQSRRDIELGNITNSTVNEIQFQNIGKLSQWIIPSKGIKRSGLPTKKIKKKIIEIIYTFKPDVIHVWGTESYWGLITSNVQHDFKVIIEIQGLYREIAKHYKGGLSFSEIIKCIGIKEIVKRNTIFNIARSYKNWGDIEEKIIKDHSIFSTHSNWAESKVRELNNTCAMYKNERILRPEFYSSRPWCSPNSNVLFTSLGYSSPFKGLHVLINALWLLKRNYPNILLYIAGPAQLKGLRRDGYLNFVQNLIKSKELTENVIWLGSLNAEEIIQYLHNTTAAIFPSFIESYGVALAESMILGVPSVASYNGGYSYLGIDNENVLFYPPGDSSLCAFQINRILCDNDLTLKLSLNSRRTVLVRNDYNDILKKQISIYYAICEKPNTLTL